MFCVFVGSLCMFQGAIIREMRLSGPNLRHLETSQYCPSCPARSVLFLMVSRLNLASKTTRQVNILFFLKIFRSLILFFSKYFVYQSLIRKILTFFGALAIPGVLAKTDVYMIVFYQMKQVIFILNQM